MISSIPSKGAAAPLSWTRLTAVKSIERVGVVPVMLTVGVPTSNELITRFGGSERDTGREVDELRSSEGEGGRRREGRRTN